MLAKRVKPLASAYAKISSALVIASGVISANEIDGDATSEEPKSSLASERPADGEGEASMQVELRMREGPSRKALRRMADGTADPWYPRVS